jgi:hypothetical protein
VYLPTLFTKAIPIFIIGFLETLCIATPRPLTYIYNNYPRIYARLRARQVPALLALLVQKYKY